MRARMVGFSINRGGSIMLADRYGLPLPSGSAVGWDAYVQGSDLLLTLYPGAIEAFDRAIAADPGFALAHAGKAQVLMREGNVVAARACLGEAKAVAAGLPAREASHIAFLDLVFAGRTEPAIVALRAHLARWPRDSLVLSTAANPNGLIGASGHIGQKHQIANLLDSLATHYGDDFWFLSHHAIALSDDLHHEPARVKIERTISLNPNNAHGAHALTHVCYEEGEPAAARGFLASWLATYPREGFFYGHLNWHLALGELEADNAAEAFRLFRENFSLDRHSGGPQQKMSDGTAFLWRGAVPPPPPPPPSRRGTHPACGCRPPP